MFVTIAVLHIIGFGVFVAFVVPSHYKGLGIGVAGLAYSLGLRHAFDADHISAIDNTTRKLMNEGKRPLSIGYWFSLGHSTIVIAIGVGIVVAEKAVFGAVSNSGSNLEQFGGIFGTVVSASFLYLIALLNIVILAGIFRVFRSMRRGNYDEAELERQLNNRGLMYRFFGRWMKTIDTEWKMYPVGVVFGMGFDTATEVALLATTALLATQHLPFYAIICLPILFTAGMSLMDTLDGIFMNFAYSWALFNPVRKVYYNLAITGLSVAICFFIGTIEVLGLVPMELGGLHGSFWHYVEVFDINKAGFVIVGMFVVCWVSALAFWRFGHVEEKWSARLKADGTARRRTSGRAGSAGAPRRSGLI
ncbi:MAG TPA: HoxN/HupN/NixA family nickel/cobalt transporter [Solirubrobacteraceae bacterium]|nr:HoxN/HupN/NixA family nickel/cobalt transporter [Solirubrobacteraceae bacterium]